MRFALIAVFLVLIILVSGCLNEATVPEGSDIRENEPNDQTSQEVQGEEAVPVLKGFSVDLDSVVISEEVLFEDDYIKNEKPLVGFGEPENNKADPDPLIEMWFFVEPGTKVHAAADGYVRIFRIEHTDDWGVNIRPEEYSDWFVGHEHILNLAVEDGDYVRAGDLLGDAIPSSISDNLWFTELSVGKGGANVFKYCPFDFLEPSLRPEFEYKINQITSEWEDFLGEDVYDQENWTSPGCAAEMIKER